MKKETNLPPHRFRLVNVTVQRPGRRQTFATLHEALEAIRAWVGFGEAERIFERTFGI